MVMPFDPFLIASVPGEVAGAVAGAGAVAIGALWARNVVLEKQAREDFREGLNAMHGFTEAVLKLGEKVDDLVERLAG